MNRAFNQQSKPDSKPEAVTSLVLGIISLFLNLSVVIYYLQSEIGVIPYYGEDIIEFISDISFIWGWLIPILGLVLGIIGLIAVKNKLATMAGAGSILSFIDLIMYICVVYILGFESYIVILPLTSF